MAGQRFGPAVSRGSIGELLRAFARIGRGTASATFAAGRVGAFAKQGRTVESTRPAERIRTGALGGIVPGAGLQEQCLANAAAGRNAPAARRERAEAAIAGSSGATAR